MKPTFKQFLITERVYQSTLDEISNDTNNLIGIEFEYFDNGIKEVAREYGLVTTEIEQQYEVFEKEVNQYLESNENWRKENATRITEEQTRLEELVEELEDNRDELREELEELEEKIGSIQEKIENTSDIDKLEEELEDLEKTKKEKIEKFVPVMGEGENIKVLLLEFAICTE